MSYEELRQMVLSLPADEFGKKRYPPTVKSKVCELFKGGKSIPEISEAIGIKMNTIHYWIRPGKKKFKEVKIKPEVKATERAYQLKLANGAEVLGLTLKDIVAICKAL